MCPLPLRWGACHGTLPEFLLHLSRGMERFGPLVHPCVAGPVCSTCPSLSQLRTTRTECVHQEVAQHQVALSVFWRCTSGVPGRLRGDQLFAAFFSRILGSPGVRLAVEAIWQACASSGLPLPSGEGWALLGPCRDPPPFQPLCSSNVVLRVQPSLGLSPECGSQPLCLGCRFWVRLSGSLRAMGGGLLCCGPWVLLYWLRPGLCLAN